MTPVRGMRSAGLSATSRAAIGAARFGIGPRLAGILIIAHSLVRFLLHVDDYPRPMLNVAAWSLFVVVAVAVAVIARGLGQAVSGGLFWAAYGLLSVAVAIDVAALWGSLSHGLYPTVAVATGGALVAAILARPPRDIVICTLVLAAVLTSAIAVSHDDGIMELGVDIVMITVATCTPAIASVTIATYARLSQHTLDRIMIQSTVTAPAYGPSLLASERLTSLDREVEELFTSISSGLEPLPLAHDKAKRAAELATELRSHLLAGRQDTWLHHAVSESELLDGVVTLDDPQASAALLPPDKRDALLSALWLLVQGANPDSRARVRIGEPYTVRRVTGPERRMQIEIVISEFDRRRIEPAAWAALHNVGSVVDTQTPAGARLAVQSVVDPPRDAG